jgi:hypothetical protein
LLLGNCGTIIIVNVNFTDGTTGVSRVIIESFDREVNHSPADLHSLVIPGEERRSLFNQHEGAELALVVLQHKFAVLKLDLGVASAHWDIIDAQVALVAATELKNVLCWCRSDDVDDSWGVFLLVEGLQEHVVSLLLLVVNQSVLIFVVLDHQWVGSLADLALEGLPEVARKVSWLLRLAFDFEPGFEALQVDAAYSARTLAALEERVLFWGTGHPAETTLHLRLVVGVLGLHNRLWDLHVLFPQLVVRLVEDAVSSVAALLLLSGCWLINFHVIRVWCITNFFNSEFNSADLEDVLLLDFVVLY